MMRVVLGVNRKIGQPNYGSEGASCEITLDLPEDSARVVDHLVAEIRAAYALAEQAVTEQLSRRGGPGSSAELPPPARPVVAPPRPVVAPAPPPPPPPPVFNAAPGRFPPPPATGRALFGWVKDRDAESTDAGLLRYVSGWAKLQGFPARMVDWSPEQAAAAGEEAARKLARVAEAARQ